MGCCDADNNDPTPTPPPVFSGAQVFSYTVTGVEPDLTNLVVPLPAARADALYKVLCTQGTFTNILGWAAPVASRTVAQLVLSLTGPATAGDTFDFFVCNPT